MSRSIYEGDVKKKNSTFCGSNPAWANACVGNNGSPDYVEYSIGFSQAAKLLIEQVLQNRGKAPFVDHMVYPVCFNMRHSVELRLKGAIEEISKIARLKNMIISFDLSGSHDIKNIWDFFKLESEKIDHRFLKINSKIEPTILDIAEVDATGQTFRYPVNTESQKHLTDISVINFRVLMSQFNRLEEGLDALHQLNIFLFDEYATGTFTKKLSRAQLFRIAQQLPLKVIWCEPEFDDVKSNLKEQYGLSSNDLSKAINISLKHYEIGSFIGCRPILKGVSEACIIQFFDEWIKLNPEIKDRNVEGRGPKEFDHEKLFELWDVEAKIMTDIWSKYSKALTPEILAGLRALFYFARDKKFSETYIVTYELELKDAKYCFQRSTDDVESSFNHLIEKVNAMDNIIMSLFFLNYDDLADQIIEKYQVHDSFEWLEKARNKELFKFPEWCGY